MISGCSGCMLWISFSTGIDGGLSGISAPVTSLPGVVIGMLEFVGRNLSGYLGPGTVWPAGTGATISGVTITISSVLLRVFEID